MNFDKTAVNFCVEYNKRLSEAAIDEGHFNLNVAEKTSGGNTLIHLACSLPSLSIILELCNSSEVQLLVLNSRLQLATQMVPLNYLTSKKAIQSATMKELIAHFKKRSMSILVKAYHQPKDKDTDSVRFPVFKKITLASRQGNGSSISNSFMERPRPVITETNEGSLAQKILSIDVKASKTEISLLQRRSFGQLYKDSSPALHHIADDERRPSVKNMRLAVRMPRPPLKQEDSQNTAKDAFMKVALCDLVCEQNIIVDHHSARSLQEAAAYQPSQAGRRGDCPPQLSGTADATMGSP